MTSAVLDCLVRELCQTAGRVGLSDAELLERFRAAGDPEAFEAIVRRHGAGVLSACRSVMSSSADVEDAFQATFIVLLRDAKTVRRGQALGGWLAGVAHRIALTALAATARRRRAEARKVPAAGAEPDLSWREACAILHEELDRLPDSYRLPLLLCYLEGKTRDEAARQLGVKMPVLHGRLQRGRERLRTRLTKRGITLSAGLLAMVANSVTPAWLPRTCPQAARPSGVGPPEQLLQATLKAATTGRLPAKVAALVHGATHSMTLTKFTLLALGVLVVGLISGGLGLNMRGAEPPAQDNAVLLAAAQKPLQPEQQPGGDNKPVAVSGKVVGPDGKLVPKVKLFVFDAAEYRAAPQAETDADGKFAFELPPAAGPAERYLVATAPGLGLGCDWVGVPAASEPLRDAVLKLPRDEPIRGRILGLEGKPLAGATVRVTDVQTGKDDTLDDFFRLWARGKDDRQLVFVRPLGKRLSAKAATAAYFTATTDADGKFTLTGVGRERCAQLTVSARGSATQVCLVPLRPDFKPAPGDFAGSSVLGTEFTLPLLPSRPVTGVVRDADKKPLPGVRIVGQIDMSDDPAASWLKVNEVEAVTDREGRYTLDGLPASKKYTLVADPKPGDGATHLYAAVGDDTPGVAPLKADFALPRGVVVTGRVTDRKTGSPVRASVFYRPLRSNKWVEDHAGYANPAFLQKIRVPGYGEAQAWTDTDGRFKLTAVPGPGVLHVQVRGSDTEGQYALATLAREDDVEEVILQYGNVKYFKTLGQGPGYGPANLHGYRVLRLAEDAKEGTADVTVDRGVTRVVKVVDPDGKPLAGAWVANDRVLGGVSAPLPGDEFKAYALHPETPRRVYAQHDGKKLAGMILLDGKEAGAAVLKLQPMATVTGRVVDRDGSPIKDARVFTRYDEPEIGNLIESRGAGGKRELLTDADGKFTLTVPGGLTFLAFAKKDGSAVFHVTESLKPKAGETLDLGDWKPK